VPQRLHAHADSLSALSPLVVRASSLRLNHGSLLHLQRLSAEKRRHFQSAMYGGFYKRKPCQLARWNKELHGMLLPPSGL